MAIEYIVYPKENYVYSKVSDNLTLSDIIEYDNQLQKEPELKPGYKELFDARFISGSELTQKTLKQIISKVISDKKRSYSNKLAIVVSSSNSFDRAKYYEESLPSDKETVIVFNSIDVAKIWLNVNKP